jgi:hypothetical protein
MTFRVRRLCIGQGVDRPPFPLADTVYYPVCRQEFIVRYIIQFARAFALAVGIADRKVTSLVVFV